MESVYWLTLSTTLTANGDGALTYSVPTNEELHVRKIIVKKTGTFEVTNIRPGGGVNLTNASSSNPIPGEVFPDVANDYNNLGNLPKDMMLYGGSNLQIDLSDTSGASNTVTFVFECIRVAN